MPPNQLQLLECECGAGYLPDDAPTHCDVCQKPLSFTYTTLAPVQYIDIRQYLNGDHDDTLSPADRLRKRLVTGGDVIDLPTPDPIVHGMLFRPSVAMLYGPPKTGKSLIAQGLALSLPGGHQWLGLETVAGSVLYVAAEGVGGLGPRVAAWCEHHNVDRDQLGDVTWLPQAVNLSDVVAVEALAIVAAELNPSLVVLDTLARCAVGVEENSAKDIGEVVAALDRLRDATTACILIVHHTGKDATRGARGSNALLGAVDTAIEVSGDAQALHLAVTAQKDAPTTAPFWLKLRPVGDSVVAVPTSATEADTPSMWVALDALRDIDTGSGISSSTWLESSGMAKRTFHRAVKLLLERGFIANTGTARSPRYTSEGVAPDDQK